MNEVMALPRVVVIWELIWVQSSRFIDHNLVSERFRSAFSSLFSLDQLLSLKVFTKLLHLPPYLIMINQWTDVALAGETNLG